MCNQGTLIGVGAIHNCRIGRHGRKATRNQVRKQKSSLTCNQCRAQAASINYRKRVPEAGITQTPEECKRNAIVEGVKIGGPNSIVNGIGIGMGMGMGMGMGADALVKFIGGQSINWRNTVHLLGVAD